MINLWPMLLPAAAMSGWVAARRSTKSKEVMSSNHLSREYVVGLNYLLNEQPDKAVDIFIKLLEVDSETVETHLALGSLFRRRGEVDRAIRIHQNLIARPQLSLVQRKEALMALGQDYMSAGVFDRAERIFLEVVTLGAGKDVASLHGLLAIYQQEKAWDKALDIVKKLEVCTGQSLHIQAAHYYCEIAQLAIKDNKIEDAYQAIRQAFAIDKSSVRASLILASIEMKQGRYKQAIRALKRVPEQDAAFTSEVIELLVICHQELNILPECVSYLEQSIAKFPTTSTLFVIADYIRKEKSLDAAIDYVAGELAQHPSIRGLNKLIFWHLENAHGKVRTKLQMLYDITSRLLVNKPIYRCGQCGYGGKHLHWHCPSCKQWGKMKPIHGLEGD